MPIHITGARTETHDGTTYLVLVYDLPSEFVPKDTEPGHQHYMPLEEIVQHRAALYDLNDPSDVIVEVILESLANKTSKETWRIPTYEERRSAQNAHPITGLRQALKAAGITPPGVDQEKKKALVDTLSRVHGRHFDNARSKR